MNRFNEEHFVDLLKDVHETHVRKRVFIDDIEQVLDGYQWLANGERGCHEWDSEEYYKEVGNAFDLIRTLLGRERIADNVAHKVCCDTYRHLNPGRPVSVQLELDLGLEESYAEMYGNVLKMAAIER